MQRERLTRGAPMPPWVRHEHQARFAFAAQYAPGRTVVDCACGEGFGAEALARAGASAVYAFDKDAETIGLRLRRSALPSATPARLASPNEAAGVPASVAQRIYFCVSDATRLPLSAAVADLYVALETIEHLDEELAFLREAVRVLKPGGVFICSTPNRTVTNPAASLADRPWNRAHVREYSCEEFVALLKISFKEIALYGQNPAPRWAVSAFCRVGQAASPRAAVALRQLLKAPRWLTDRAADHAVEPVLDGAEYEYLVAVCR